MKTIFCDIDGTILEHQGDLVTVIQNFPGKLLPGVRDAFIDWSYKGYTIVLVTARPESMRDFTNRQLLYHGLYYDFLLMGIGRGERIIINDAKDDGPSASSIVVDRNCGLEKLKGKL